eukprot:3555995-Pleurochrysis_carterae.AAC.2
MRSYPVAAGQFTGRHLYWTIDAFWISASLRRANSPHRGRACGQIAFLGAALERCDPINISSLGRFLSQLAVHDYMHSRHFPLASLLRLCGRREEARAAQLCFNTAQSDHLAVVEAYYQ